VLDLLGSEALEERVEPGDCESDPARPRLRGVRLGEQPADLVDVPRTLVADASVWGSPEEPRVSIEADVKIGYRDTGRTAG
jgi:hypothetical protein